MMTFIQLYFLKALLILENEFVMNSVVKTVCLPPKGSNFDNQRCLSSGWGKDKYGKEGTYPTILKKVEVPVIPRDNCETMFKRTRLGKDFKLHEGFLCAGKFFISVTNQSK
jgi:plasma kallikrein